MGFCLVGFSLSGCSTLGMQQLCLKYSNIYAINNILGLHRSLQHSTPWFLGVFLQRFWTYHMLLGPSVYLKLLRTILLFLYANLFLISKSTTNWTTLPRLAARMIRSLYTLNHSSRSFCMQFLGRIKQQQQKKTFLYICFIVRENTLIFPLRQVRAFSWVVSFLTVPFDPVQSKRLNGYNILQWHPLSSSWFEENPEFPRAHFLSEMHIFNRFLTHLFFFLIVDLHACFSNTVDSLLCSFKVSSTKQNQSFTI